MNKVIKILFFSFFISFLFFTTVKALDTPETGYRLDPGEILNFNIHDNPRIITNTGSNTYFIPTLTTGEWSSFVTNYPSNITVVEAIDCAGVPFGDSWQSDCGCVSANNDGDDCDDCAGTPNGSATTDNCGICDDDASNDCTQDDCGVWGGDDCTQDECGVWGGDNSTCGDFGTPVTDIDNNEYETVWIGDQLWMAENLRVTQYNNGTTIQSPAAYYEYTDNGYGTVENYVDYEGDIELFGRSYNWYAASGVYGNICPSGWHVPSDDDWKVMEMFIGMTQEDADQHRLSSGRGDPYGNEYGKQLKQANWVGNGFDGAWGPNTVYPGGWEFGGGASVGCLGSPQDCTVEACPDWNGYPGSWAFACGNAHNQWGFSAIGGGNGQSHGYRFRTGYFWTSTDSTDVNNRAYYRQFDYRYSGIGRHSYPYSAGFSIRCVAD